MVVCEFDLEEVVCNNPGEVFLVQVMDDSIGVLRFAVANESFNRSFIEPLVQSLVDVIIECEKNESFNRSFIEPLVQSLVDVIIECKK